MFWIPMYYDIKITDFESNLERDIIYPEKILYKGIFLSYVIRNIKKKSYLMLFFKIFGLGKEEKDEKGNESITS